jgi:uncharacterized membrane protein
VAAISNLGFWVILLATLGCGLVAGVFFAFSTFVMSALARLQPSQGIAAMQSINITAINPLFMGAIFGTAAACLFLLISSISRGHSPNTYRLVGSLLYLLGTVVVTMVFNVPLNNALAVVNPDSSESATLWVSYLNNWTFWNHVRTLSSLVAAILFTLSLSD